MNLKKYFLAVLAVFVGMEIMDYIIHNKILMKTYESLASVWRPDMMEKMWVMQIVYVISTFLFVYIFIKGYENKGVAEGIRYGLIIGLFVNIPAAFSSYAVYPIPLSLAVQWFVYGMIEYVVLGMMAALVYKPRAAI